MSQAELADLSRILYSPITIALYVGGATLLFLALAASVGSADDVRRGRLLRRAGWAVSLAGVGTHLVHEIVRGLAQQRMPLGNMFEVTSLMALIGVAGGLWYVRSRGRDELAGFVMLGGTLLLGLALLMYAEPGPLMPILDTWWRTFHVSLLVGAMGVFSAGLVFTGLYLLADTGRGGGPGAGGPQVGQGGGRVHSSDTPESADVAGGGVAVGAAAGPVGAVGQFGQLGSAGAAGSLLVAEPDSHAAVRARISTLRLALGTFLATSIVSWVWAVSMESTRDGVTRMLIVNLTMVAAALIARWFTPYLPSTDVLDSIAHRTIAFGFVLWTVGTIAGAMWAEQSWGRFWGWDPKETGALLTWIAYAAYLHGRATKGVKGRSAAWLGIVAFITLMATYLVANYVIVGLHSYAGL